MATLRNKRKLVALNKKNFEEHPRSNLVQHTNVPRSQDDYITQVPEGIEGRVTKKLSQEFSRTENRILGALSRLAEFFLNPLIQGHSGFTPGRSRNARGTNQGTNEDDSQSDPHHEARVSQSQTFQNCGPNDRYDMLAGIQEEILYCSDMVRGVQEEIPYCYPAASSRKQKKARSTSQPQFCSENSTASFEANQILLALQQLASKSQSTIEPMPLKW